MDPRALTFLAVTFDDAVGTRTHAVRRLAAAIPVLAGTALLRCDFALETSAPTLLAYVTLEGPSAREAVQRVRFWGARLGASCAIAASDVVRAAWRARLAACRTIRSCGSAAEVGEALDALLGDRLHRSPAPRPSDPAHAAQPPVLEIDVGGPGAQGLAFNARERLLFVPGHVTPPIGDELALALRIPGGRRPERCRGRVVRVRDVPHGVGAPAGYVLQLGPAAPSLTAALGSSCESLNADAMVEEARRTAPRYRVRIPVRIEPAFGAARRDPPAALSDPPVAHAVSLSVGGAFIETDAAVSAGPSLSVRFLPPERESFTVGATVVYATAAGVGVKFDVDHAEESVCRLLAGVSARPRRALVVDDDGFVRRILCDALEARGYEALDARSGDEAVRILGRELYALDVVVTDVRMDGIDGSQVVEAVSSAKGSLVAIVVVSGRLDEEGSRRLLAAGADAVLDKALGPARVADEIDAVVERRGLVLVAGSRPARPTGTAR